MIKQPLCRRPALRLCLIGEVPRIAVFLQLRYNVLGYGVSLGFRQPLPQPANDLAGAAQRESDLVLEHVTAGHPAMRTQQEQRSSR